MRLSDLLNLTSRQNGSGGGGGGGSGVVEEGERRANSMPMESVLKHSSYSRHLSVSSSETRRAMPMSEEEEEEEVPQVVLETQPFVHS